MNTLKPILALVGCDAPSSTKDALSSLGFLTVELPRDDRLPFPVSSHADMLLFPINDYIFTSAEYFRKASDIFSMLADYGYKIIHCDVGVSDKYPQDIAFNMAVFGKSIMGNTKHNAKEALKYAKENGFDIISVKQGYTKCSSLILGDKAIITSDDGIANVALSKNALVLKTKNSADSVVLKGYNYGFIGGACGVFNNTVYFSGDIGRHPNAEEICSFCNDLGYTPKSLSDEVLTDVGGIMFFTPL